MLLFMWKDTQEGRTETPKNHQISAEDNAMLTEQYRQTGTRQTLVNLRIVGPSL